MDKYIFPAILEPNPNGGYSVSYPDLPGCIGYGETLDDALKSGQGSLELHLYGMEEDGDEIPQPSNPSTIELNTGEFISCITAWMPAIRNEMQHKSIKKTLTIPAWLNDRAELAGINFSQTLQGALMEQLGLQKR